MPRSKAKVKVDREGCYRYYDPCPQFSLRRMPQNAGIVLRDGGFWVIDAITGIRYRRITMDDLPKHVSWNTRGPVERDDE